MTAAKGAGPQGERGLAGYLADWFVLTVVRERSVAVLRAWLSGFAAGWRMDPGQRNRMSWRTTWRLTRAGRPPLI